MPPEPLILGFDTSAAHCAAALVSGSEILHQSIEPMQKGQAERLFPLLAETLRTTGKTWSDLAAIGVGIGPGNFTGTRLSVSAARGLSLSLKIPAVGVSLLEAQALGTKGTVISSLDARRGSLYVQVCGTPKAPPPALVTLETLPLVSTGLHPTCIGFAADEIARRCKGKTMQPAFQPATAIAKAAADRFQNTAVRPAPLYLRAADAAPSSEPTPVILP